MSLGDTDSEGLEETTEVDSVDMEALRMVVPRSEAPWSEDSSESLPVTQLALPPSLVHPSNVGAEPPLAHRTNLGTAPPPRSPGETPAIQWHTPPAGDETSPTIEIERPRQRGYHIPRSVTLQGPPPLPSPPQRSAPLPSPAMRPVLPPQSARAYAVPPTYPTYGEVQGVPARSFGVRTLVFVALVSGAAAALITAYLLS